MNFESFSPSDWIALASIVFSALTAILTTFFSRRDSIRQLRHEEKRKAYVDFFEATSNFMFPDESGWRNFQALVFAYNKVRLFAPDAICKLLHQYIEACTCYALAHDQTEKDPEQFQQFVKSKRRQELRKQMNDSVEPAIKAMRKDLKLH